MPQNQDIFLLLTKLTNENLQLEKEKQEWQVQLFKEKNANKLWELRYKKLCDEFDNFDTHTHTEREREENPILEIKNDAK